MLSVMLQLIQYCFELMMENLVESQEYSFEEQYAVLIIQRSYRKHLIRRYFKARQQEGWETSLLKK